MTKKKNEIEELLEHCATRPPQGKVMIGRLKYSPRIEKRMEKSKRFAKYILAFLTEYVEGTRVRELVSSVSSRGTGYTVNDFRKQIAILGWISTKKYGRKLISIITMKDGLGKVSTCIKEAHEKIEWDKYLIYS